MQKYVTKPYSQIFPQLFLREQNRICSSLQEKIHVEHVGSSAVPGLSGKGIIDIAISCKNPKDLIKDLEGLGYRFAPNFSTETRLFFKTQRPEPVS